ncbi:MAG: FtsX-like permease family protein, partial [Bacteroidales bacterium]|nr:FtsX-like permease family protein [Bacteroidales bacterium]
NKPAAFQPLKPILSSRYINEYKFTILFFTFSLISFLIAIIGIIGLTAFITEQKTREIAIHKVLGASLTNIIGLYFRELIGLLFIATILALPIAYFAMIFLLNVLVVNPSISWFLFLQGSILSLGISILVVIYYSYQAYNRQTLEAIKYE